MDFSNIAYLRQGNSKQQQAYAVLTDYQILSKISLFDPILVGTIPINIDIEGSDLDIICCFTDPQEFAQVITDLFKNELHFSISNYSPAAIVASFTIEDFKIEIFGQAIPTRQQFAYRHMIIEHQLLQQHGASFRQQIIALKQQGHKTEPAFALALGLTGDPYQELLKYEMNDGHGSQNDQAQ